MKKLLLFVLALVCCQAAFSQDIVPGYVTESKAAQLEGTKGAFLKIENFKKSVIGLGEVEIIPSMITDIRTGEKTPYIIVKTKEEGTPVRYTSVIDYDEIPSCIEALEYIMTNEITSKPTNDVHVFILTRDNLEIGAIWDSYLWWRTSFTHVKYVGNPRTYILAESIGKVIDLLKSAKEVLDEHLN